MRCPAYWHWLGMLCALVLPRELAAQDLAEHDLPIAEQSIDGQTSRELVVPERPQRTSLFFFEDELTPRPEHREPQILHAAAIQMGPGGQGRVWINGTALEIKDQIGPATVARIEPDAVYLQIEGEDGASRVLRLAINQSVEVERLTVREGATLAIRNALARTRLP